MSMGVRVSMRVRVRVSVRVKSKVGVGVRGGGRISVDGRVLYDSKPQQIVNGGEGQGQGQGEGQGQCEVCTITCMGLPAPHAVNKLGDGGSSGWG